MIIIIILWFLVYKILVIRKFVVFFVSKVDLLKKNNLKY